MILVIQKTKNEARMLKLYLFLFLAFYSIVGFAQEHNTIVHAYDLNLGLPSQALEFDVSDQKKNFTLYLAANTDLDSSMTTKKIDSTPSEYRDRMFTSNKIHKYLGIGSLGAAVLTGLSPKEEDGPHEAFGKASGALGIAALITGLIFHYDELSFSGGFDDPDNLHALFAGLGAIGLATAASEGPESGHGGIGSVGGIAMAYGVKYTW